MCHYTLHCSLRLPCISDSRWKRYDCRLPHSTHTLSDHLLRTYYRCISPVRLRGAQRLPLRRMEPSHRTCILHSSLRIRHAHLPIRLVSSTLPFPLKRRRSSLLPLHQPHPLPNSMTPSNTPLQLPTDISSFTLAATFALSFSFVRLLLPFANNSLFNIDFNYLHEYI